MQWRSLADSLSHKGCICNGWSKPMSSKYESQRKEQLICVLSLLILILLLQEVLPRTPTSISNFSRRQSGIWQTKNNTSFIFNIAHDWFLAMLYPVTELFPNVLLQTCPTKNTANSHCMSTYKYRCKELFHKI